MPRAEPKVFIVDDDDAIRDSLTILMQSIGLSAESFATAPEFLESFDPEHPGCLVLDIRMPGMSGMELQERLDAAGDLPDRPWRRADGGSRHAGRRDRFPAKTV